MKYNYLNLRIGAPARLSILKRDFNTRSQHSSAQTWRDVRFATFLSDCSLSQGLQDNEPIWYTHGGEFFRNERDADRIISMRHTGWYTDEDCNETAVGIVGSLPHGRFLAGYRWTSNDERVWFPQIFDDESDAARMADEHARVFAEQAKEDDEKYQEARRLEDSIERKEVRLRECLALRNKKCMEYVRSEIEGLIESIRNKRDRLKTEFADYV